MNNTSVAVIGVGFVGKSMLQLFPDAIVYDPQIKDSTKEAVNSCEVAFCCVPTPNPTEGRLDTSIVEEVVEWCQCPLIVLRSTVNPGDSDRLAAKYKKHIVVQPEFLGETPAHPLLDPKTRPFLIIGGELEDRRKLIELYTTVYNANISIRQLSSYEAEICKLSENRAISHRVAEFQELFDACERAGVDYYTIREAVYGDDPRFLSYWSFIYPNKRGMNSSCIPKDVFAWKRWCETLGYEPKVTAAILGKNREWLELNVS